MIEFTGEHVTEAGHRYDNVINRVMGLGNPAAVVKIEDVVSIASAEFPDAGRDALIALSIGVISSLDGEWFGFAPERCLRMTVDRYAWSVLFTEITREETGLPPLPTKEEAQRAREEEDADLRAEALRQELSGDLASALAGNGRKKRVVPEA